MDIELLQISQILRSTPIRIETLISFLPAELVNYKNQPHHFSIFDILGHFIHGEKTDWIPRLNLMLKGVDREFEPFDRFAQFKASQGKTVSELVSEFKELRKKNMLILESLHIDLSAIGVHPTLGEVTVNQLLHAWAVHDLTHLNQVNRIIAHRFDKVGPWKEYLRILND